MTDHYNELYNTIADLIYENESFLGAEAIINATAAAFDTAAATCVLNGSHMRAARYENASIAINARPDMGEQT